MDVDGVDYDNLRVETGTDISSAFYTTEQAHLARELDRRIEARRIAVPTNDNEVRKRLRDLKEPITLFGERKEDRRDRLRALLAKLAEERGTTLEDAEESESSDEEKDEEFFTEGLEQLLEARRSILDYSVKRAKLRIARQKLEASLPLGKYLDQRKSVFKELKTYTTLGSQIGDDRPLSGVKFSPNSQFLATASWGGTAKIWDVPSCTCRGIFKGHGVDRISGLAWHPKATLHQPASGVNFATGAQDGKINFWSLDPLTSDSGQTPTPSLTPLTTLEGHSARICRVAFHPSGHYLASASYDQTWRLWDVLTGTELLVQEGHSKEVYAVAFQDDGSLLCSGGLDAIGRVWDLRSGRTAMVLDGHSREILGVDFSPNGYQIATGSGDDSIRIWDMRQLKSIYSIAAHGQSVSDLVFFRPQDSEMNFPLTVKTDTGEEEDALGALLTDQTKPPLSGLYLASSGFDGTVKLWSSGDWQCQKVLSATGTAQSGREKVMSVDLSRDGKYLAMGEYGRTFRLVAAEGVQL